MASSAISVSVGTDPARLPWLRELRGPCRCRIWGKPYEAVCARGSWDTRRRDGGQRVVRAALGGAGLGVAPLWIRHCRFLSAVLPGGMSAHLRARGTTANSSFFQLSVFILLRRSASADHRASALACFASTVSEFRFFPQCGQSPLQSSRQSALAGRESNTCSRNTSSTARRPPS